ncbi:hypothetical protein HKX48_002458 [Thoreauomyces humboldtii]|nr:hypothetical protein HKX48_002458 [Thoreauomyces humboldtii]
MGRVKLGTHIETNHKVGIKIIPKEALPKDSPPSSNPPSTPTSSASGMNKKLEREITIMKLIQHPNILQLHDVYETDKELFLILEYVEGGELFDYLVKKGRLSEHEALEFFQQIMYGIDFCHRYLICHRDLKPENLLLDRDRNVKIADFGMASLQVTGKMLETSCGSPHYASPEIIKGIKYDGPSADIWSCGVILYALLTGNLPFDDENIRRLLQKVKSGSYFIPEHVSEGAKDLLKRMMVTEPARRITMQEIFRHPWFSSYKTKNKPNPPAVDPAQLHVDDVTQIDPDILESLSLLGWGDEKVLIAALQDEKPGMAKAFYNLLVQRKYDNLEHYDPRDTSTWDVEGGPRRRTSSYMSLNGGPGSASGSRHDLYKSEASLGGGMFGGGDAHSRKSTDELRKSSDDLRRGRDENRRASDAGASDGGSREAPSGAAVPKKQGPNKIFTGVSKYGDTAVRVNSPLSASAHFDESRARAPLAGTSDTLTQLGQSSGVSTADHSRSSSANRASSSTPVEKKKMLTISIPVDEASAPGPAPRAASSAAKAQKPYLGDIEKRHTEEPSSPYASKFHRARLQGPPTPIITSSPKRSWFASLFNNFKPEPLSIKSTLDYQATQTAILDFLEKVQVSKVEPHKDGWKCRYDSASSPSTASSSSAVGTVPAEPRDSTGSAKGSANYVKFQVTIAKDADSPEGEPMIGPFRIQFVQTQGANSILKKVVDQLAHLWEQSYPTPILE